MNYEFLFRKFLCFVLHTTKQDFLSRPSYCSTVAGRKCYADSGTNTIARLLSLSLGSLAALAISVVVVADTFAVAVERGIVTFAAAFFALATLAAL